MPFAKQFVLLGTLTHRNESSSAKKIIAAMKTKSLTWQIKRVILRIYHLGRLILSVLCNVE